MVTHPNLYATIQSWQNKNIKQTQNSLQQIPKSSNTLLIKTTTMAANSTPKIDLWNDLWNVDTLGLQATIVASAATEPTAAMSFPREHADLELTVFQLWL
jgi:hypothetical protein